MSRKINPFIFRVVLIRNWSSSWFVRNKFFCKSLFEDFFIRNFILNYLKKYILHDVLIQKSLKLINIFIIVYNKDSLLKFLDIFDLKKRLTRFTNKNIYIDFVDINMPEINLALIFHKLKKKILSRKSYKVLIKNIFYDFFSAGGLGIKIVIRGRLAGSIMSKKQIFKQGNLPLQRISADVKYFADNIKTIHGVIGIKLWSYMGNLIF